MSPGGRVRSRTALAALLALLALRAGAAERPLWELGLGAGMIGFNDYRGAAGAHLYPVPFGEFIYRGRFLHADRDGVRGRLLHGHDLELELSVNATAPVFSRNSAVRSGMPNLDSTLEFGPALQWHLWRSAAERLRLDFRAPVREAVTVAWSPKLIGAVFAPQLDLDWRLPGSATGWNVGLLAGPLFAEARYNQYYYSVAPAYATAARPAYDAPGGYAGSQLLVAASKRYERYWIGAYVRHDWLQHAAFEHSPLVQQASYWSAGFGIVWFISASARMVENNE